MAFFQQLKTLPLFLNYFLHAVDEHSLQAPFAFRVFTELREAVTKLATDPEIESARNRYLKNRDVISGQDFGAGTRVASLRKNITVRSIARYGVSSPKAGKFITALAKRSPGGICIELGTSLGISTAYLGKSHQFEKVYSLEGNHMLVNYARDLHAQLDLANCEVIEGDIDARLPLLLNDISEVSLAVIDANHTCNALLRYFDLLIVKMSPGSIMLIDDIRWSTDMYRGWETLVARKEVSLSLEYMQKGVLFLNKEIPKQHYVVTG